MTNTLSQVPRELAERLIAETDNFGDCSHDAAIAQAEAVIREAMQKARIETADEWEDCGSLACTLLDLKLERVTFGPEGMTMDCETAKSLANAVIARLRTESASSLTEQEVKGNMIIHLISSANESGSAVTI